MGAFELDRERGERRDGVAGLAGGAAGVAVESADALIDRRRVREECIIALKVYDHCRQPD